jgi:hypothetical protein
MKNEKYLNIADDGFSHGIVSTCTLTIAEIRAKTPTVTNRNNTNLFVIRDSTMLCFTRIDSFMFLRILESSPAKTTMPTAQSVFFRTLDLRSKLSIEIGIRSLLTHKFALNLNKSEDGPGTSASM